MPFTRRTTLSGTAALGIGLLFMASWCATFPHDILAEGPSNSLAEIVTAAPTIAAFLFCALRPHAVRKLASTSAVPTLDAVSLIGRILRMAAPMLVLSMPHAASHAIALAGMAAYSVAEAILFIFWLDALSRISAHDSSKILPASFLAAGAVSFVTHPMAAWIPDLIATMAPFVSALLISVVQRHVASEEDAIGVLCDTASDDASEKNTDDHADWTFPFFPVAIMAAYCFAFRFTLAYTLGPNAWGPLGMLLVAATAGIIAVAARDAYHPTVLFKCAFPLMLAGLLAVGFLDDWRFLATLFTNAGNIVFELFILIALVQLCFRFSIDAVWMFGIVESTERMASVAGSISGNTLVLTHPAGSPEADAAIAAIVVVLAVLSMSLYSDRSAHQAFGAMPKNKGSDSASSVMSYYERIVWDCERAARK